MLPTPSEDFAVRRFLGRTMLFTSVSCFLILSGICLPSLGDEWKSGIPWNEPAVVTPGADSTQAPSDAIVLFNGQDLSQWDNGENWAVKDGVAESGKGMIFTKQPFGDCQLHIEWASPSKVEGDGQGRGNSGVYLMGKYEVQVLDSFENQTYFDGQAASIYKQSPPLVNACRKPGEWQTYDIIFKAPRFDSEGVLTEPGTITVLQNGVLVQNHFVLEGASAWDVPPKYTAHADKLPLALQDHGNPVRFRNIWIRELSPRVTPEIPGQKQPSPLEQLKNDLKAQVHAEAKAEAKEEIKNELKSEIKTKLAPEVYHQIMAELKEELKAEMKADVKAKMQN